MKQLLRDYFSNFGGLSKEVWWLSLITFVNRVGAMVIPFLSLYLNESLCFEQGQIGWIMTAYGLGSLAGSILGGKLTDRLGYYKVILMSLVFTGINFLWVMHVESFEMICVSFFLLILLADMGRPAFFVALSAYSKPENKTRSLTLIRLAINLGMGAGPMLGGILIATLSYQSLFYIDGFTCLIAALIMIKVLHPKKAKVQDEEIVPNNPVLPQRDFPYILFLIALCLFAMIFMPIFSLVPLFYRSIFQLSEFSIGLIIGLNGFMIVVLEMPLISWLQKKKWTNIGYTIFGLLLTGISYLMLLYESWVGIVVLSMVVMTIGEMISFPFSNKFALDRSKKGRQGAYMGLYTVAFAVAHIFSHNASMQITEQYGFQATWIFFGILTVIAWILLVWANRLVNKQTAQEKLSLNTKSAL